MTIQVSFNIKMLYRIFSQRFGGPYRLHLSGNNAVPSFEMSAVSNQPIQRIKKNLTPEEGCFGNVEFRVNQYM